MGEMKDKIVLITGGSRGIGAQIVRTVVAEGGQVAFTYRSSQEEAEAIVSELATDGAVVRAYKSDAADYDQCEALVSEVVKDFGRIDVLVNNAGITRDNLMLRMSESDWDAVMDTNLKSVFNLTKHTLRPMLKAKKGSIINIGSVVGLFGNAGQSNYAAAKAGLVGFSKSIAKEVGSRSIRCNVVAPGFIDTDMTKSLPEEVAREYQNSIPLKRFGDPREIAEACVFLGSDRSTYITGQVLSVCGGMNM